MICIDMYFYPFSPRSMYSNPKRRPNWQVYELAELAPKKSWYILVYPGRLTWTIIMEVWKTIFLSKWVICRFHVNLPGWSRWRFQVFFIFTPILGNDPI